MIGSPFERGRPDQYPTSYLCGPRHGPAIHSNGVVRWAPHNFRGHISHKALILDEWRQSELADMDGEHAAVESIDQPAFAFAPTSGGAFGPDGSIWSARAGSPDCGMRRDCRYFPVLRGS